MQARSIGYSLGLSLAGSIDWDKASEVEKPVELAEAGSIDRLIVWLVEACRGWLDRARQGSSGCLMQTRSIGLAESIDWADR